MSKMNNMTENYLKTIPLCNLDRWDVKQFFIKKYGSKYPLQRIGLHTQKQTEKLQLSDYPNETFDLLGVSNKIGMFDSATVIGKSISQKYHIVKNNWLAYNPYRINVGSIGIKNENLRGCYISPAYVVFSCLDTVLPDYIWLVIKTRFFNSRIKETTTGSVRQILHYEKLADIEIPIPSISEQRQLLDYYHETLKQSIKYYQQAETILLNVKQTIQKKVSKLNEQEMNKKRSNFFLETVSFSNTNRWEVDYIQKEDRIGKVVESFTYPAKTIGELQTESLFGLSIKASLTQEKGMIPVLRMGNIINGKIDYSDLKYLPYQCAVTDQEPDKWLLTKGDLLVTRTNGSKDLVGKTAVFDSDDTYTYASYLIRYRFNHNQVLPEYVNIMFMTPLVREQIAVLRRQGGGQYNLNSDEINSIRIPVPPLAKQHEIIQIFNDARAKEKEFYIKSIECKQMAVNNFENTIFNI